MKKVKLICKNCGNEFEVIPSRSKTAKYCCRKCSDEAKHAKPNTICTNCGKEFHMKQSRINKYPRNMGVFCCKECAAEYRKEWFKGENNHQYGLKGELNASFKGYKTYKQNHKVIDIMIYMPNHPNANKDGRIVEHRYIVEQNHELFDSSYFEIINNYWCLKKEFQIHHKDGNHNNNNIDNLIITTRSTHTSIHNKEKEIIRDSTTGRITGVVKRGELLEHPEVDNQQPSQPLTKLKGPETNS